jgi:hypothetical protein
MSEPKNRKRNIMLTPFEKAKDLPANLATSLMLHHALKELDLESEKDAVAIEILVQTLLMQAEASGEEIAEA